VDIGTGDGLFVYRRAQRNPQRFFIGIDANRRPLEKISEKIYRRAAKGGLTNALFVQAAVEDLPAELDGIATEVRVQFPWGSLLQGVAEGDKVVMRNLRRICCGNAELHVTISVDSERDRSEWERLGLPPISVDYIKNDLASKYRDAGFRVVGAEEIPLRELSTLNTSWAKRLHRSSSRVFFRIVSKALSSGQ
jgi:16S rRNA (adenine(1408)-N(1))-methyltransferase